MPEKTSSRPASAVTPKKEASRRAPGKPSSKRKAGHSTRSTVAWPAYVDLEAVAALPYQGSHRLRLQFVGAIGNDTKDRFLFLPRARVEKWRSLAVDDLRETLLARLPSGVSLSTPPLLCAAFLFMACGLADFADGHELQGVPDWLLISKNGS